MELALPVLVQLAAQSPLYLAWLVGIVFALIRWRDAFTFRLVLIALVMFLLTGVAGTVFNLTLPLTAARNGSTPQHIGLLSLVVNVVLTLLNSVGWVLILVALFWRRPASAPLAPARPPGD